MQTDWTTGVLASTESAVASPAADMDDIGDGASGARCGCVVCARTDEESLLATLFLARVSYW